MESNNAKLIKTQEEFYNAVATLAQIESASLIIVITPTLKNINIFGKN